MDSCDVHVCVQLVVCTAEIMMMIVTMTARVHIGDYGSLLLVWNSGSEQALTEWEYIPPVGPRPVKGFVGLKNAGATCYMNSVTQQVLYCVCSASAFYVICVGHSTVIA